MCAIWGYRCFDRARPRPAEIAALAQAGEIRGHHAAGMAWFTSDGSLGYVKAPKAASEWITAETIKRFFPAGLPTLMTGHNRWATHGSQHRIENAHPIIHKSGVALTHNGVVAGGNLMPDGIKPDGETDSEEILLRWVVTDGDALDRIVAVGRRARGYYACALLDQRDPGALVIFSHDAPVHFGWDPELRILWYASTAMILRLADLPSDGVDDLDDLGGALRQDGDLRQDDWIRIGKQDRIEWGTFLADGPEPDPDEIVEAMSQDEIEQGQASWPWHRAAPSRWPWPPKGA